VKVNQYSQAFWSVTAAEILKELQTTPQGLSEKEAQERLARYGSNPEFYDHLWPGKFHLRVPHLRSTSLHPSCSTGFFPNRLVSRIGGLCLCDRPRHSHPQTFLREQARKISTGRDSPHCCGDTCPPFQSSRRPF